MQRLLRKPSVAEGTLNEQAENCLPGELSREARAPKAGYRPAGGPAPKPGQNAAGRAAA